MAPEFPETTSERTGIWEGIITPLPSQKGSAHGQRRMHPSPFTPAYPLAGGEQAIRWSCLSLDDGSGRARGLPSWTAPRSPWLSSDSDDRRALSPPWKAAIIWAGRAFLHVPTATEPVREAVGAADVPGPSSSQAVLIGDERSRIRHRSCYPGSARSISENRTPRAVPQNRFTVRMSRAHERSAIDATAARRMSSSTGRLETYRSGPEDMRPGAGTLSAHPRPSSFLTWGAVEFLARPHATAGPVSFRGPAAIRRAPSSGAGRSRPTPASSRAAKVTPRR
jgi:hypothetical protein